MVLCSLIGLAMLANSWDPVLERLRAEPGGARAISSETKAAPWLHRATARLGVHLDSIVPILGDTSRRIIVLRDFGRADEPYCAVALRTEARRLRTERLDLSSDEDALPLHAARMGRSLYIGGLQNWLGNAPSPAVERKMLRGGRWMTVELVSSEYQAEGVPPFRRDGRGNLLPIVVGTTTYPPHLSTCHAGALFAYEERWSFPHGRLKRDWIREGNGPLNRMDALYKLLEDREYGRLRAFCLNRRVWRSMVRLRPLPDGGGADQTGPDGGRRSANISIRDLAATFHWIKRGDTWLVASITPTRE